MGRAIVGGAVAVLMFDAAAAWASLVFGFPYGSVAIGSWVIYAVVGFVAGRYSGVLAALVAGVAVGLVDASAGWATTRAGITRPQQHAPTATPGRHPGR